MFEIGATLLPDLFYAASLLAVCLLSFCIPLLIFKIRNELVKTNNLLEQIAASTTRGVAFISTKSSSNLVKICGTCRTANRGDATVCSSCKRVI